MKVLKNYFDVSTKNYGHEPRGNSKNLDLEHDSCPWASMNLYNNYHGDIHMSYLEIELKLNRSP